MTFSVTGLPHSSRGARGGGSLGMVGGIDCALGLGPISITEGPSEDGGDLPRPIGYGPVKVCATAVLPAAGALAPLE